MLTKIAKFAIQNVLTVQYNHQTALTVLKIDQTPLYAIANLVITLIPIIVFYAPQIA